MSRLVVKIIKDKRGQILPMMAFGIAVFVAFASISVDYGYLAWQKRSLQNAADAGALAGAWELPNRSGDSINYNKIKDEAEFYTNDHVADSFKEDEMDIIDSGKALKVVAEKDYERIFFSRIFSFFDDEVADSDLLFAEATAKRFVYYWDGLLPFSSLEKYEEGEWKDFDFSDYGDFRTDTSDFDKFLESLIGDRIDFREMSATSPANYGLLYLDVEGDPRVQPKKFLEGDMNQNVDLWGKDLEFKPGWVDAIEGPGKSILSTRLDKLDYSGYIIAVLPSVADGTDPSGGKEVAWGDYVVIELINIEINYTGNGNNKKVDKDNPVSGEIAGVYDISNGDIPNVSFGEEMRIGAILIK